MAARSEARKLGISGAGHLPLMPGSMGAAVPLSQEHAWNTMKPLVSKLASDLDLALPQYAIEGYPGAGPQWVNKRLMRRWVLVRKAYSVAHTRRGGVRQERANFERDVAAALLPRTDLGVPQSHPLANPKVVARNLIALAKIHSRTIAVL